MNQKDGEFPDCLGGLGGMLPAEVLKKLNELLEQLHKKVFPKQGNIVLNVYEKGSLHVDHVDNQNFYSDACPKPKKTPKEEITSTTERFNNDTPLSALFRNDRHDELRKVIESWRPYLIGDNPNVDALAMTRFQFDFGKVIAMHIYIDLGHLLYIHALKDDNMNLLAKYLFYHTNLSNSQSTLYAQLRKYKKR